MKELKYFIPILLLLCFSCSNKSKNSNAALSDSAKVKPSGTFNQTKPPIAFEVINQSDNASNLKYDIYTKDISKIKVLNEYLENLYNPDKSLFININYFDNRTVAKIYFEKQFSTDVSEKQRDQLFKNYIASYKYNPSTGYNQLSFMHH